MRLSAYISGAGVTSRRKAAQLIKEGKVKIAGKVITEPWYVVKEKDAVSVNGKLLSAEKKLYYIVNKPKGVTTTLGDPHAEKKVSDLIPHIRSRLFPVGRLDKDTTGLIILTNDGDLCYKLTHPKFEIEKEYNAHITGVLDKKVIDRIIRGVLSDGDVLKVKSYKMIKREKDGAILNITIAEGKKRHIRRMFEALGITVMSLCRIRIGNLALGDLKTGCFKQLDKSFIYSKTIPLKP